MTVKILIALFIIGMFVIRYWYTKVMNELKLLHDRVSKLDRKIIEHIEDGS